MKRGGETYGVVLVGGGLANGLVALAMAHRAAGCRVLVLERGERLGGVHTWSFHDDDVDERARPWVLPLAAHRWDGYDVRFPSGDGGRRGGYWSFTGADLDAAVRAAVLRHGGEVRIGVDVMDVRPGRVRLGSGEELVADLVIDARGPEQLAPADAGWQKFVGLELALAEPCGLKRPLLMDATVPQIDGYRFVYALPFAPDRVLVEDTYFSDGPQLDDAVVRERVLAWARGRGFRIDRVVREERGVLAMPWRESVARGGEPRAGLVRAGYGAGFFHPTTGYSLPVAVRVAEAIAEGALADAHERVAALEDALAPQRRFFLLLNRLLFTGIAPAERWGVFARFFRLPDATIARFFSMRTTRADRARILCGKPPRGLSVKSVLFPSEVA